LFNLTNQEAWMPIGGYDGIYEISDLGRVRSLNRIDARGWRRKGRILQPSTHKNGYLLVCLYKDGISETRIVHRLVAEAFIPNPENKPEVSGVDGVIVSNAAKDLAWCDRKEVLFDRGVLHRSMSHEKWGTGEPVKKSVEARRRPVIQYDKNGSEITSYPSVMIAERKTGVKNSNIIKVCRNKLKSAGGFMWKYSDKSNLNTKHTIVGGDN